MVSADKTQKAQENYLHFEIKENVRALRISTFSARGDFSIIGGGDFYVLKHFLNRISFYN